jgi:hypothetical protein
VYRYDFNLDGYISKEDIRIVLSYIPLQRILPRENGSSFVPNSPSPLIASP